MLPRRLLCLAALVAVTLVAASLTGQPAGADPLPSWNDGPAKKALLDFVARVTKQGGPDFVPVPERVATFDNDGTLWCEHPVYFEVVFSFDRVKALADKNPDWKTKQPYKGILEGDYKAALAAGEKAIFGVIAATHAGMTPTEFDGVVRDWLKVARHPRFKRPYTDLVYQPQLELLAYLRANGFKTFIVSGGEAGFMRAWADGVYGIPPEQTVGSRIGLKYELRDGKPLLERMPTLDFIDDGPGKPVGIGRFIGRRPILAFGNSDGDYEMLQYTTTGTGPRLGLIVHHTDAEREYAYDRDTHVGKLDKALTEAPKAGWVVVDMKKEWKTIFPPEKP